MSYTPGAQDISVTNFAFKFPNSGSLGDSTANPTTTVVGAMLEGYNGTTWDRLRTSVSGTIMQLTGVLDVMPVAQYLSTRPSLIDQQSTNFMGNSRGDLSVAEANIPHYEDNTNEVAFISPRALSANTGGWTAGSSIQLTGSLGVNVKATAGRLRRIGGINTHATTELYLLVIDKATAPVAGDQSVATVRLPPALASSVQAISPPLDFGIEGKVLTNGIAYAISSTPQKVTLGTDVCFVFYDYI